MFGVETCAFLPDDQCDRCNIARQGERGHRWSPPFGKQGLVKIAKWSGGGAGLHGRTLEDILEIMVVVIIQPAKLLWFLGTSQLSFDKTVLRAVMGLQPKPTVVPQLPLGAKPMRRLHQRNQLSRPKRTNTRNLAYQLHCTLLPSFGQQFFLC